MENEVVNKTRGRKATPGVSVEQSDTVSTDKKPLIPKDVDPNQYVTVRNGFQGRLVYKLSLIHISEPTRH